MTRQPRQPRHAPAFTLLELVIGTTMSLAIASVAMGTLVTVQATQKESMLKNAATRDAMYMLDMVGGDLGYAGVGVPWGREVGGRAGRMRPVIRVGGAQQIAFIGDLPMPNSDFNGLTTLAAMKGTGDSDEVAVTSEISLCAPSLTGSYVCDPLANSLVRLDPTATSCSTAVNATTCPWALGKWAGIAPSAGSARQLLLLTAPNGAWTWRRVAMTAGLPADSDVNGRRGINLDDDFPVTDGEPLARATFAQSAIGSTVIATLDRVYYSVEKLDGSPCDGDIRKCVLARRHCWGEVLDVQSPGFPAAGSAPLTSAVSPAGCSVPNEGTAWEPVANNLDSFTFRYFARDGAELTPPLSAANLARVASVGVDLVVARDAVDTGIVVRHRVERRFFLDAGDGYGEAGRR